MRGAGVSPAAAGGGFAGCGQRVFRPLRRAGISPRARGDQRPCLWTPRFFEKNRVKLLMLGFYMDLVRCRRICAVRFSIHASHCCGGRASGPSAPPGDWYMGYGFAGMRRSSVPHTARRHTQVPPYIPGRTADVVRRAGPMCPAAGTFNNCFAAVRKSALGCPPSVGKSGRRGIFRQGKVWVRSHTGCMARNRTAAMAEKARRAPQTHGRWVAL